MFKIRGPWDGQKKKTLCLVCQVMPSSSQICKEVQKPCCGRGPGWLSLSLSYLLDECPKNIFFELPGSCAPGDKKAQSGSSVGLHALSHFMQQRLQNVTKKKNKAKRVCQLLKFWIHVLDREIYIFWKFHVKIKFWSKVIVHEIRGTNFWDTL